MIKLLIADDERIIRETISNLIDWESLGIVLTDLAKDGTEAYHIILDECPDIVLTDIKMPGLTGLDLIARVREVNKNTHFIILSGYGEFEYAKQAMNYGIRHYILKPCNEDQIIAGVKELISEISQQRAIQKLEQTQQLFLSNMHSAMYSNIINDGLLLGQYGSAEDFDNLCRKYSKFLDMETTPYEIYYIHYLEKENWEAAIQAINIFHNKYFPGILFHYIYVKNTLLFFFQSCHSYDSSIETCLDSLAFLQQNVNITWRSEHHKNLRLLLEGLLKRISRYATIFYSDGCEITTICNYENIISQVHQCACQIFSGQREVSEAACATLESILSKVTDANLCRQLLSSVIIQAASKCLFFSSISATELIMELGSYQDCARITSCFFDNFTKIYAEYSTTGRQGDLSTKIKHYIAEHLSDSRLSLKWIAENYLYMNEDYVSKKFFRETGQKFSACLTEMRIQKAKELLAHTETDKISNIAELVGCGNNPKYFSQIFKKQTGMTPRDYMKMIRGSL